MSRKAYASVEGKVMVPVKVKLDVIVQADEGIDVAALIRCWAKREEPLDGGDVELDASQIVNVGSYSDPDDFGLGVEEAAQEIGVVVGDITITDSE